MAVVVVIVANLAYFGTRNEVRGTVAPERPAAILELTPQEGDHVIPQSPVVVDLRDIYTGQLALDGHLIPQDQVEISHPNLFELTFEPTPAHDVHKFAPGPHFAVIQYWPQNETYEKAQAAGHLGSYTWKFDVG